MNRFDIEWSVPLLVKCCISCLRIRELENFQGCVESSRVFRVEY